VIDVPVPAEEIIAGDQKRFVADSFARAKIIDPLRFYQAAGTELIARNQLQQILSSQLRRVVGSQPLARVLSEERGAIMRQIKDEANIAAARYGIEVIDVRIRRADLPEANAQAIYQRMQSEREREAREFRAQGAEAAQRIRARADRDRTVTIAEAERDAQKLRGQGDAEATRIYAEAFSRDPEFYAFSRSLDAYREALGTDTTLVLSPDSPFLRYLDGLAGRAAK
jgi:membrane protease subunit HflC